MGVVRSGQVLAMSFAVSMAGCGGASGAAVPSRDAGADLASRDAGADPPSGDAGADLSTTDSGTVTVVGWRPFNDSSPWNTPIPIAPAIDPNSVALITDFSTIPGQDKFWLNIQDYSIPVYWVDSTVATAVTVMAGLGGTGFRTGAANDSVTPGTGPAPIPSTALPAVGTDAHLAIVDRQAKMEWGFFAAAKNTGSGAATAPWKADMAAKLDLAGTGVRPPKHEDPWWAGHGPRACGFGLIAGLITMDDIRAGRIDHALVIAYPHIRSRYYTPPASTAQGTFGDAQPTRGILCGGRIQLDPTLDVTTLGLSAAGVAIARALQVYGAFVGDYSGAMSLYADSSPEAQAYWKTVGVGNETAGRIPLNRFRVLQIGKTYDDMN